MENVGLFGVFLFFVHTCLVLMWSLERRPHTLDFYIRRVFRIYPLAILSVIAAVVTRAPVSSAGGHFFASVTPTARAILFNCLLMQNLRNQPNISGVLWSLAPEVDMYVFLPCLFFYATRSKARWPMLTMWVASVALIGSLFTNYGNNFPKVIPDFLAGVIAYIGFKGVTPRVPAWVFPPFLAVLFYVFLQPSTRRLDWYCCLALGLALPYFKPFDSRWILRPSHELAKYSYGLYLFHPFCLVLGVYLLPNKPFSIQLATYLGSLLPIAVLGYHLIEKPMIDLGARFAKMVEQRYEMVSQNSI